MKSKRIKPKASVTGSVVICVNCRGSLLVREPSPLIAAPFLFFCVGEKIQMAAPFCFCRENQMMAATAFGYTVMIQDK